MTCNQDLKTMLARAKRDAARPQRQSLTMLVQARDAEETAEGYDAYERAIDALLRHPKLQRWREEALNDLADMGQEAEQ
ncbi:hypothetical protein [Dinoroseobacter sp. S124A]|uniref:hypothetical protein n=1 Tax=Dinoroseobacter sp. S124A TaxID=3415128 RepID=UPI003C7C4F72